jgi:tetratricopeptide (TPR) repeat protein
MVLGFSGYAVLRLMGDYRMFGFGVIWFCVTLLPVSQIFPHHELLAEHYLYLPSFGFCLAVAVLINTFLAERWCVQVIYVLLIGVALLFTVRIAERNKDWKNGLTLWKKTVNTVPQCARARNNLGFEYDARGWVDKALYQYEKALAIKPEYAEPYSNLGRLYYTQGQVEEAITMYRKALDLDPKNVGAYVNLGGAYIAQDKIDDALQAFQKAGKINPRIVEVYVGLGVCFAKKAQAGENKYFLDMAIYVFKKALELKPCLPEAHNNLASTYYLKGDYSSALYHTRRVRELGYEVSPQLSEALKPLR